MQRIAHAHLGKYRTFSARARSIRQYAANPIARTPTAIATTIAVKCVFNEVSVQVCRLLPLWHSHPDLATSRLVATAERLNPGDDAWEFARMTATTHDRPPHRARGGHDLSVDARVVVRTRSGP